MTSSFLRSFRIFISVLIIICFSVVFLDFKNLIPAKFYDYLLFLQFVPSAIRFFDLKTFVAGGFVIIIFLTFLTGRTYCSFLCPLGIGQDIVSRIGGKIKKKFRRYGFKKPHTILRYSLLAITLIVTIFWGTYMITLLDPYSIFGRFMTSFLKPVVILFNNFLANIFGKFDIYTFDHITVTGFQLFAYTIPVFFFLLTGILSLAKGRLYCNMICPVGTLLGLISKISLFRIKFDTTSCSKCGRCSLACKSSCIDFINSKIDVSRCVGCFNCVNNCNENAISYGLVTIKKKKEPEHSTDESRRNLIITSALLFLGMPRLLRAQENPSASLKKESTVKEPRTTHICPPGGITIARFNERCTACSLCITSCPNGVLQPAFMEYGLQGIMQPVMNYHKGFCNYNCTKCSDVCPTDALQPLVADAKKLTQIGKAIFIKDNCVVKTEKTACGACSESCPTKAVHMIPYEGNLVIPEVTTSLCIGCGHCEYACPTSPFKAIFVEGNAVHIAAVKPDYEQSEKEVPSEFPF